MVVGWVLSCLLASCPGKYSFQGKQLDDDDDDDDDDDPQSSPISLTVLLCMDSNCCFADTPSK
eukprot:1152018-Amphidinium_carterae.2